MPILPGYIEVSSLEDVRTGRRVFLAVSPPGTLRERAEAFLRQCASCDAGLPMSCSCPAVDPRPIIQDLLSALDAADAKIARLSIFFPGVFE